jgi:cytoskeleton protein RodZ
MTAHMVVAEHARRDFGAHMKKLREERGVTLRQVADATKISIGALEALERNDVSRLPGGIFSRAFVRTYAVEIGQDPEHTVREFLLNFPHDSATADASYAVQDHETGRSRRRIIARVVVVAAVCSAIIGLIAFLIVASAQ